RRRLRAARPQALPSARLGRSGRGRRSQPSQVAGGAQHQAVRRLPPAGDVPAVPRHQRLGGGRHGQDVGQPAPARLARLDALPGARRPQPAHVPALSRAERRRAKLYVMSQRFTFYYDVVCPYAYLASTQIEAAAARAGGEIEWVPVLLGGIFRAIGQADVPAARMPAAKQHLNLLDMKRYADYYGV